MVVQRYRPAPVARPAAGGHSIPCPERFLQPSPRCGSHDTSLFPVAFQGSRCRANSRFGTRTQSSTSCTSKPSRTRTATASATSRGCWSGSTTCRNSAWTCIWLLPFYPSPLRDDGYDIADYYGIHPSYGTIEDFQRFIDEAHRRGLRVISRPGAEPHLRSASLVPARSPRAQGFTGARLLRLERQRRTVLARRASSSPTRSPPTGRGTRSPSSTTGTASSRTSPISTGTTPRSRRRCSR